MSSYNYHNYNLPSHQQHPVVVTENINTAQKMYINPHFGQPHTLLHINPKFHPLQQNQNVKIHFNPKFMNAQKCNPQPAVTQPPQPVTERNFGVVNVPNTTAIASTSSHFPQTSNTVSKSRYSIVRKNIIPEKPKLNTLAEPHKNTVSITKYKSVHIDSMKKVLEQSNKYTTDKQIIKTPVPNKVQSTFVSKSRFTVFKRSPNTLSKSIATCVKSKYKFVRKEIKSTPKKIKLDKENLYRYQLNRSLSTGRLKSSDTNQKFTNRINIERGKLKKNNIPCPLFRKYGKCIRQQNSSCDFQHDKKNVSICRKFIKGLCFDPSCLLSHDLTMKKMPTCYFYLKGMCTKSNCPYLHVKLSDKATICSNFIKGYCENGDKCLKRHVNSCPEEKNGKKCHKKNCSLTHTLNRQRKIQFRKSDEVVPKVVADKPDNDSPESDPKHRYYDKNEDSQKACKEKLDVIKPSRCKLGTLPSFIKL